MIEKKTIVVAHVVSTFIGLFSTSTLCTQRVFYRLKEFEPDERVDIVY